MNKYDIVQDGDKILPSMPCHRGGPMTARYKDILSTHFNVLKISPGCTASTFGTFFFIPQKERKKKNNIKAVA